MTDKAYTITVANIETLQAILDEARTTGEIEAGALREMADTIVREFRMKEIAAYLAPKSIRPIEKARVGKLMKSMSIRDRDQLDALADHYKRGDVPQMLKATVGLPLSDRETRIVKAAIGDVKRGGDTSFPHWDRLSAILADHGITPEFKTVRLEMAD